MIEDLYSLGVSPEYFLKHFEKEATLEIFNISCGNKLQYQLNT